MSVPDIDSTVWGALGKVFDSAPRSAEAMDEFDAWLAAYVRTKQKEAWDDGTATGCYYQRLGMVLPPNPYREGAES